MRYLIVVLVVLGAAACTRPKDLQFIDVQNIKMLNVGLTESTVSLDVRFYNPNKQQVKLKDAAAKVYANSTFLGNTTMDSTITVPRKDTFAIPLTLKIPTLTVVGKLAESLRDSTVDIKVEGTVKMGKAGVFVNYPINYQHKQSLADLHF